MPDVRRVTLKGLLQVMAVLAVLFSLITLLPIDHHGLQLFTHFRLQYLAASLLLLPVFAFLRSPTYTVAMTVTALVNAIVVLPWYFDDVAEVGQTELKLLQANVLSTNVEHQRLFALIAEQAPDLVILQEVSPQWETALLALHADYPHRYIEAREGKFGIALLSKMPLTNVGHVDSAPLGFPTLYGEVAVGNRAVRLVGTHPMIPLGALNYAARNEQLREVRQLLGSPADSATHSTILAGDLNVAMWDISYRELEAATGLRNARRGHGILPTWPTFMPFAMIPIDHVLVSNDIVVDEIMTGPRIGSDHLPLVVTLSL